MSTDSLSLLWWWIQPAVARFFCMQYQKTLFFSYDLSSNTFLMYAVSEKPVLFLWSQFKHVSSVCRQCQKTLFCSSDLSSNTLWTLPRTNYFIMLTFLLIALMRMLSGTVVVISYLNNLILFIGELQSWRCQIHPKQQRLRYCAWVYSL